MRPSIRRSLVAAATVVVLVVATATPAPAAVFNTTNLGGTLVLKNGATTATIPLGPAGTGTGCGATSQIDITATTADVTGFTVTARFTQGTTDYVADIVRTTSGAGVVAGTALTGLGLTLRADVYVATAAAPSCAHGATRTCRFTQALTLAGTYNGPTGNPGAPVATDTITLSAPAVATTTTMPCGLPFSALTGGTAEINTLVLRI